MKTTRLDLERRIATLENKMQNLARQPFLSDVQYESKSDEMDEVREELIQCRKQLAELR